MNQPGGCPLDLYYEEPAPPQLDLVTIIGRGRRIRRRQAVTWAAGAMAACAAVASVVVGVGDVTGRPVTPAAGPPWPSLRVSLPIDPLVAANPPANGVLTLVSASPRHWTTVAWTTRDGYLCWAIFRTPTIGDSYDAQCPAWPRTHLPGTGPQAIGPLALGISPAQSQMTGRWPILGLVSPQAVRVRISARGFSSTASVARVPVGGGEFVGVFIMWAAPVDITSRLQAGGRETAYGRGGRIIAGLRHVALSA